MNPTLMINLEYGFYAFQMISCNFFDRLDMFFCWEQIN